MDGAFDGRILGPLLQADDPQDQRQYPQRHGRDAADQAEEPQVVGRQRVRIFVGDHAAGGVPFAVDLGSGALLDLSTYGLPREPLPQEAIAAGADLVIFSGDKLLGGPQAGIIVGRAALIDKIKRDPLKRALRVGKLTLAALEATLRIVDSAHRLPERLPTLALLTRDPASIRRSCEDVQAAVTAFAGPEFAVTIAACASQIGSGAQPVERLPSAALVITPARRKAGGLKRLETRLRQLPVPVIGRIHDGSLWLDGRGLTDTLAFVANLENAPC